MEIQPPGTVPESEPLLARDGGRAAAEPHDEHDENVSETEQASISDSFPKLGATAFDFLTTGVAMAAVGVGTQPQVQYHLLPLTM
jgi:hypothetical protein